MKQQHGIRLLVVDYVQLLTGTGGKNETEETQISKMVISLHAMAHELNIPVIAIGQTNEEGKFRGSRAARHHTENLLIIKPCEGQAEDADPIQVRLIVDKARNAPAGAKIDLIFFKSMTRFQDASKVADSDVPYQPHTDQ